MKPTVFHVTHWKAGSQWIRAVLNAAEPGRVIRPGPDLTCFSAAGIVPGAIYSPVYADHRQFSAAVSPSDHHRVFTVIRDPRDTAVSWYFSLLYSHPAANSAVRNSRDILSRLSKTDGMALVITSHLCTAVWIQRSWMESGVPLFRYEDLFANQQEGFRRIFEYCELDVSERKRQRIVARNSFGRKTWWRWGRENVRSHLRKGVPGDWKNHFCDRLKRLFKAHYNESLVRAGYEQDDKW